MDKVNTDILVKYINSLKNKYAPSQSCLVIILDGVEGAEIELPRVKDEVDTDSFPFTRLMFTWMNNDKVYFGETFPEYGMEEYNPEDMIS